MLKLIGLSLAILAIFLMVIAILKVTYHVAASLLSIRKETRVIAYLLGPFAFLQRDLFDLERRQHLKRAILWSAVLVAAVGLSLALYPAQ